VACSAEDESAKCWLPVQEFDEWAQQAGFARTSSMHLAGAKSVAIAYKS
jgi:hypothetical protein